jgi:phosphoglycolate phosphatase
VEAAMKPRIKLLVTDLDNTLYDWVSYFSQAFLALIEKAEKILDVPRERLLDEFKSVHQCHHNSEHPFALLEIASVKQKFGNLSRQEIKIALDDAFHAFNRARKATLHAYEGVNETLRLIKESGCIVVGHTEATVPNALFRLSALGLDKYLARLYAIEPTGYGHPDPQRASELELQKPADFVAIVPKSMRKPNPDLLLGICTEFGVENTRAAYVGDSLTRDISMAKAAGVFAVWARYGTLYNQAHWATLVRVTHWSKEDVQRESELRVKFGNVHADVELNCFSQLLDEFAFESPKETMIQRAI